MGGNMEGRVVGVMPGLDLAEQGAWEHFLEATVRIYSSLNRALTEAHKLTLIDVRLLDILDKSHTGSTRMGELADQLLSLPSRITRQIRRLETAGLVQREASPDDGRGVLARITEQGRHAVAAALVTYGEAVQQWFLGPLTRTQISSVGENCRRLVTAARANGGDGTVTRS